MTDFSSKLVVYYNINMYNKSKTDSIKAHYIQSLVFPLVNKASEYSVAVTKSKFDISQMIQFPPTPPPPTTGDPAVAPVIPPAKRYDKLIIQSSSLSVIGSIYGGDLQNQTIMDVDFPQIDQTSPLYYQPTYLQPLTLSNPLPVQLIDVKVVAQFEDGTQEDFMIPPETNWTCRLAFIRR
ncbi:MAG: hypothetical protein EBW68_00790 [Actinobacteria bacterium]|nr:hypothetical protein [Actinomycetota bacterium]